MLSWRATEFRDTCVSNGDLCGGVGRVGTWRVRVNPHQADDLAHFSIGSGRHTSRQRGQSVVETAMVAPFLLAMILGIVELANAFNAYIGVINASREGARLAARGNIFQPEQVLMVVEQHGGNIDLASNGAVIMTTVHSDTSSFTSTVRSLVGSASSHFDQTSLQNVERQATTSDPTYMRNEDFVVMEVFLNHHTITGFLAAILPMYSYTIMPISAPS